MIDRTFAISLLSRTDRRELLTHEMHQYNMPFRFWMACRKPNGADGLKATMLYLFQHCMTKDYKNVLVLEDDVSFLCDPNKYLPLIFEQLPVDYHCLYLGCNMFAKPERISENILRLNAAYASHAVLYSKKGMELILNLLGEESPFPYDLILQSKVQCQNNCFVSYPMIATQRISRSDISEYRKDTPGIEPFWNEEQQAFDAGKMMATRFHQFTKDI